MKLLLIEDELSLAHSIAEYLRDDGYLVEQAMDYAGALEKIEVYQYDCILVDIMLTVSTLISKIYAKNSLTKGLVIT